jgi:2-iminobutanoate/2-iminopropanoate deaminase
MNHQLITFDSTVLLQANEVDVSALSLKEQLEEIFKLAADTLAKEGLTLDDVILVVVEVSDMKDRPIVNEAQKAVWKPENYPARIILERGGYKAGAGVRIIFTATKEPHVCINTFKGQIPTGPFSRSAVVGNRVYGCGVRGLKPETQKIISDDVKEQARQCLRNLDTNMRSSGSSIQKAYSFSVYLTDLANVDLVLEVFAEFGFDPDEIEITFEKVRALNEYHPVEIACNALL